MANFPQNQLSNNKIISTHTESQSTRERLAQNPGKPIEIHDLVLQSNNVCGRGIPHKTDSAEFRLNPPEHTEVGKRDAQIMRPDPRRGRPSIKHGDV